MLIQRLNKFLDKLYLLNKEKLIKNIKIGKELSFCREIIQNFLRD
jgi:hypothetical protein